METLNEQAQSPIPESTQPLEFIKTKELREKYSEILGVPTHSNNRAYLIRRIAAKLEGREDLGNALHVVMGDEMPAEPTEPVNPETPEDHGIGESSEVPDQPVETPRDPRLPPPGTILTKKYKGTEHQVTVLESTFEFEGEAYTSLSTIAKKIAGCCWNGFTFFGLGKRSEPASAVAQPEIRAEEHPAIDTDEALPVI